MSGRISVLVAVVMISSAGAQAQSPSGAGVQPHWAPPTGMAPSTAQPYTAAQPPAQPAYGQPAPQAYGPQQPHGYTPTALPGVAPTASGPQPNMPPQPAAPSAPFVLTPWELSQLEQILQRWEQFSAQVTQFECEFVCFDYRDDPSNPVVSQGKLQYAAPDRGRYDVFGRLERVDNTNNYVLKEGIDAERWIADGSAIYRYDFARKVITKHPLSPEMRGVGITSGPLPFVFGAKAEELKSRYYMRISTPNSPAAQGQIWLDAWPRTRRDASEFLHAEIILLQETMQPLGLKLYHLNGRSSTSYTFKNAKLNRNTGGIARIIPNIFATNPFEASPPGSDWTVVVRDLPLGDTAMAPDANQPR